MRFTTLFKYTRFLIPVLITSLLISCSASQHAGESTIKEPAQTENDENVWFLYYQDQFDTNEGNVDVPSEQYPQCAIDAYRLAKENWQLKVQQANVATITTVVVSVAVSIACVVILFHFALESIP